MLRSFNDDVGSLYQLVYVSQISTSGMLKRDTLKDIEQSSAVYNSVQNISGVCCYGRGYFLQYIEGSEQALTNLKNLLLKSIYHQHMRILKFSIIPERKFPDWPMRLLVLEKWTVKDQQLQKLLPFAPFSWIEEDCDRCITILQQYYNERSRSEEVDVLQPAYNTLGIVMSTVIGRHQAYFIVKVIIFLLMGLIVLAFIYVRLSGAFG